MTSYRRETQKSVGFYADVALVSILEAHLRKARINKSQFIRDAIAEKLARSGISIPENITIPYPPYAVIGGVANMNSGTIGNILVGRNSAPRKPPVQKPKIKK